MIYKVTLLIIFFFSILSAQTEWERWDKKEISYQKQNPFTGREYKIDGADLFETGTNLFVNAYWLLISDVDGDNCPFHPGCSSFLRHASSETNPFKAVLMFADRFTRDMNFINRSGNYPLHISGKYYDPVNLYLLDENEIVFYPPDYLTND